MLNRVEIESVVTNAQKVDVTYGGGIPPMYLVTI